MRFNRKQVRDAQTRAVKRTKKWGRIKMMMALAFGFGVGGALGVECPQLFTPMRDRVAQPLYHWVTDGPSKPAPQPSSSSSSLLFSRQPLTVQRQIIVPRRPKVEPLVVYKPSTLKTVMIPVTTSDGKTQMVPCLQFVRE